MATRDGLTATQIGAVGEAVVSTELLLLSRGQLTPFHPMADDSGIDLLVYDKVSGRALPIQVKSRTRTLARSPKQVHFEVRTATVQEQRDAHVLAILFDDPIRHVERAWLIPVRELRGISRGAGDTLVIRPSRDLRSKDKYSPYRCEDMAEAVRRLVAYFASDT